MSKRFAWLLGVVVLVCIALLMACGNTYNSSSDGLVLVGSQGSGLVETYTFGLNSGQIHSIANSPPDTSNEVCVLNGVPSSIVLDPIGAFAYVIINQTSACPGSIYGIAPFKVNSDGTMTAVGKLIPDPNPVELFMDSAGKFLFVAEGLSTTSIENSTKEQTPCVQSSSQYGICAYAIGSGASLANVPVTYNLPLTVQPANFSAIAATPTVLPPLVQQQQVAECSSPGNNAATVEYLYATDAANNLVFQFEVNTSSGALRNPGDKKQAAVFTPGAVPSGVIVDPCNRFVYVSNQQSNTISAYAICNGSPTAPTLPVDCPTGQDGTLAQVAGSPFSVSGGANGPGPLIVDPFGNYLYVLDTLSNQVSTFHLSPVSGSLTAGSPAVVATGLEPKSLAIRSDDNWLFVANFNAATLSQFLVTPATGALTPLPTVITDNLPWGVAVK
jgi:6-phosphogluconolactonase (cycloisomerase 2 family)